jgi:hypothetical protein
MSDLGRKSQAALLARGLQATFVEMGGISRAAALTPEERKSIDRKGALARWKKHKAAAAKKALPEAA